MESKPNRLIHQKSPYLLQHAYNPVDWHPWGAEAFEKAQREDKPVFLSIGYSTCHWCHVMERESFEDPEAAALMNEHFVCIKVDREERPDLDHVYMTVCQMMTGSGGWPLTIVMTPERKPFFAGTYIPRENRFGRTGMLELIPRIGAIWRDRRAEVIQSAASITQALKEVEKNLPGGELDVPVLDAAFREFTGRYDATYGGFGSAPKFPTPHNFLFLLRYWKRTGHPEALRMVERTLQEIRWRGIYDHIGFGFHRYSTDRKWHVPHFEKMLYDQAMLSLAYLESYQATGNRMYGDTAREIFQYVLRDMRSPEGGFFSAEDADSEGVEGKFYLWEEQEIRRILNKADADLACRALQIGRNGNFRDEATGENSALNIPYTGKPLPETALEMGLSVAYFQRPMASIRARLFQAREGRVRPHTHDKILTDWNGLMIAALARGARVLGETAYRDAARDATSFILNRMRDDQGRLLHRYRDGEAGIAAHLDDYAFFVWGLIEFYEASFDVPYLEAALELNERMLGHFWDEREGGLFFSANDGEPLLVRKKEIYDGATPSGNAVAMLNLLRLSRMTGRVELERKAAAIGRAFSGQIKQYPSGYTQFLVAVDFALGPSCEVVLAGPSGRDEMREMVTALRRNFIPGSVILFRPSDEDSPGIDRVADFVKGHVPIQGKPTAYVCRGHACEAPTTDVKQMLSALGVKEEDRSQKSEARRLKGGPEGLKG
jgi:uncharacterized protein YyaL (SSP411 family)